MNGDVGKTTDSSQGNESRLVTAAWEQFDRATRANPAPDDSARHLSVPGYRILCEIHRGGQGVVYQAIQESTRRKMAIKVLKDGPFADRIELARFEREIDVLSRLNHPHIVTIHDRGVAAGHAYYVMDYVAGQPLDAYVAEADLSTNEVLDLFVKICDAVNVAHLRGVIHRDLKPGNIRINLDGEPRILDFGLAKLAQESAVGSSAQDVTLTGQFVGSLNWASPEQVGGNPYVIDLRTDVYSLGVILHLILTGALPYPTSGSARDVLERILHTVPIRPSAVVPRIDDDVDTIVLKCLAKEPERRYQSAGELARDVRHCIAGEPIEAKRDSFGYVLRKQLSRHRGATAVAIAFISLIAGGLAYCVAQWRQADKEAVLARKAEGEARARADEVKQVANFQKTQLSDIDPKSMGMRIRADLLKKARAAAERSGLSSDEANTRVAGLESSIAGADFTGVALDALDENYFRPALEAIEKQFTGQPLVKAQLLQTLASTLLEVGLLDAATGPQSESLAIRRRELGDDHADTLESMGGMGLLKRAQGKNSEAESFYRETLEKRRHVLGEEHPDTLTSLHNMGALLQAQGKLSDAESYYRDALEKRSRTLGPEHPDTLTSMSSVGYLLTAQGKWDEAEPFYRDVLEKRRRVLGEEHPHTLFSINNLGALFQTQRKFDEAEKLYAESLLKRRRVLGDDHPDTLQAINNMGTLFYVQRRFVEAEPYYREAMEKRRKVLGIDHPNTLNSIAGMGAMLQGAGRLDEAEPFTREALELRRRLLPPDHQDILNSINNLAVLLDKQGNAAEAEALYRESLEGFRRTLGAEHPYCFMAVTNLSVCLQKYGKQADAVELLASVEPIARRKFVGPNAPRLGRFLITLGHARVAAGQFDSAEATLMEAQEIMSTVGNAPQWNPIDALHEMVGLYDAWQAAEPGKGHDAKAGEWRAKSQTSHATTQAAPNGQAVRKP